MPGSGGSRNAHPSGTRPKIGTDPLALERQAEADRCAFWTQQATRREALSLTIQTRLLERLRGLKDRQTKIRGPKGFWTHDNADPDRPPQSTYYPEAANEADRLEPQINSLERMILDEQLTCFRELMTINERLLHSKQALAELQAMAPPGHPPHNK